MSNRLALVGLALLAACRGPAEPASKFPEPHRPVAPITSSRYLPEDARDSRGEFEAVVQRAEIRSGMYVADIGAGEGYYTVRLSPIVGRDGRVLAEDIIPQTIRNLAGRIQRERLDNVAVKLGEPNDPELPDASFDRILMIHMYHEIESPYDFLCPLRDALERGGSVVVVDADRPTERHGTPPQLLVCEFNAVGYELRRFERLPDTESYFASFEPRGANPSPEDIVACEI